MRIQRLENQLRQLTGQNEELQYRNRQLEERLRQLGDTQMTPGQPAAPAQPGVAAIPPGQANPAYRPPPSRAMAAPACKWAASACLRATAAGLSAATGRFPGADRSGTPGGSARPPPWRCLRSQPEPQCPGGAAGARRRPASDPTRDRRRRARRTRPRRTARSRQHRRGALPARQSAATAAAGSGRRARGLPPRRPRKRRATSSTSASAICSARIMRSPKRPCATSRKNIRTIPLMADSQYWLGESYFQRQQYRDAAEAFLGRDHQVSTNRRRPRTRCCGSDSRSRP